MSTDDAPNQETTEPKSPVRKPIPEILTRGTDSIPPLPVDESAAALETQLQKETDGRNEDRFYAFAIGTVLFDAAIFQHVSWIGVVCIFLLEIVILLGLAKRWGNEHVTILLNYLFHKFCERIGLGKD